MASKSKSNENEQSQLMDASVDFAHFHLILMP